MMLKPNRSIKIAQEIKNLTNKVINESKNNWNLKDIDKADNW